MFQPVQIAATVTINEAADFPAEVLNDYEARRDALVDGLARIGWHVPKPGGSMFVWAPIPEPTPSSNPSSSPRRSCATPTSPCRPASVRPRRWGFVRFALIENEKRIAQGIRNLRRGLPKLG